VQVRHPTLERELGCPLELVQVERLGGEQVPLRILDAGLGARTHDRRQRAGGGLRRLKGCIDCRNQAPHLVGSQAPAAGSDPPQQLGLVQQVHPPQDVRPEGLAHEDHRPDDLQGR
jgi:hypothetical protein